MAPFLSQRNPTRSLKKSNPTPRFRRGALVEVASSQGGFVGSYYEGTVVADHTNSGYIIQYKDLVTDDLLRPLRPQRSAQGRRWLRRQLSTGGCIRQRRVGRITGGSGDRNSVFFDSTGDEIVYGKEMLRLHQDWIRGKWVYHSN